MTSSIWRLSDSCDGVDWARAKADLAADDFDNGRSATALRASFENSRYVVFTWIDDHVIGMARLLSDGVCNAYLLDVWTQTASRRQGIGAAMVRRLIAAVPGQHVGWQTDDAIEFYTAVGARRQPEFMSVVSGTWLDNDANR
jgi:GNAT superfamily N-acetyltransferase